MRNVNGEMKNGLRMAAGKDGSRHESHDAVHRHGLTRAFLISPFTFLISFSFLIFISSCARMGSPDGGWYDDTPPHVVSATPADRATGVKAHRVIINFDEFIKIEDAQNKVIVSPPQLEMPEIKASGRRIIVDLKDSLKENTTYTVDFSDAITDNNEGNPMGNYTYSFSTGSLIDTLEVSGYCLSARDLEPIKGILVGLYEASDTTDSLFYKKPFVRISRTNGSGRFTIKGVAPGEYVVYALHDSDGDFLFSQKSEMIGHLTTDTISPTWKPDIRQDTVWRDSLHILNILRRPYTHFLPDDVTLLCYQHPQTDRSLLKTERVDAEKLTFYFTYGSDSLPRIEGLNFPADSAFVVEASAERDTVTYWLRDTTLVNMDTLRYVLNYLMTDTLGQLVEQSDTLEALAKTSYARRLKELTKEREKWEKEQEKHRKRNEPYDSVMPVKPLQVKLSANGQIDPLQTVTLTMPEPLTYCDTSAVKLTVMIDSVWQPATFELRQTAVRDYLLDVQWEPGTEYRLAIDAGAFRGLYGLTNDSIRQGIKVRPESEFSLLNVIIAPNPVSGDSVASVIVELMDGSDKVVRRVVADEKGIARFRYVKPGTYYLRALVDTNGNGNWDTGDYAEGIPPEAVYYFPEAVECKAQWDLNRQWNITSTPRYRQKPAKIIKQKPDKEKQLKNRNLDRANKLGIEYMKATGIGTGQ